MDRAGHGDEEIAARVERTCAIGGRGVRLRCDAALGPLLSALCHRDAGGLSISLDIDLSADDTLAPRTQTTAASSPDGMRVGFAQPGARLSLDRAARRLTGVVAPAQLPRWERAKPLSLPLSLWASDIGLVALHAGCVGRRGAGVLFAGPSGSGKSTCALACAAAGFDFLSDDLVFAESAPPWRTYPVYASAALAPAGLSRIDGRPREGGSDQDKTIVRVGGSVPGRVAASAIPVALMLPRLVDVAATRARPATPAEALARLAPSSLLRRAVPAERNLRCLARLVGALPAFWLDMRPGPGDIPAVVDEVLEKVACQGRS